MEDNLKNLPNEDILLKCEKLNNLINILEKIMICYSQSSSLINQIYSIKETYIRHSNLLEQQIKKIKTDSIFDNESKLKIIKESNLFTKDNLIQKYIKVEMKYNNLLEYYNSVDRNHYNNLLEEILNEMY